MTLPQAPASITGNIWVPAGVAVLTRPRFANNAVTVSVKTCFFTSMKSTFLRMKLQCSGLDFTVSGICTSVIVGLRQNKRGARVGMKDGELVDEEACCH